MATARYRAATAAAGGTPKPLPFDIVFTGKWTGPTLRAANTDDAFTQVFTARGAIRRTTSTANDGQARATLRSGTVAQFSAACRALRR
jgi:hypothetical protein